MWEEKCGKGTRYCDRYTDPITMRTHKVSVVLERKDKRLARQMLDGRIRALTASDPDRQLTLRELVEEYREYQRKHRTASTCTRNEYAEDMMMRLLGADTLVSKLSAGYVRRKFDDDNPGTVNERYVRFKAMMRWAYQNDYVEDIRYLDKLKPLTDKKKREKLEEKFLETDELRRLLDGMEVEKWSNLAEFMALSGLRCGEAIALCLDDIDLKSREIRVNKTRDAVNHITTPPKTAESVRVVDMQPELYRLCKSIKTETQKRYMVTGVRSELFMSRPDGDYLEYYAFNKYLRENADRILGKYVTTHTLRHTHVSLLAEQGVPLDLISQRMGHADSRITREVYLHVTDGQRKRNKEIMESVSLLG